MSETILKEIKAAQGQETSFDEPTLVMTTKERVTTKSIRKNSDVISTKFSKESSTHEQMPIKPGTNQFIVKRLLVNQQQLSDVKRR